MEDLGEKMKVLLYGLGRLTGQIEKLINKEHEIVGYTDSFSALNVYNNKKFYKVDEISSIKFDYVVITVIERRTAWEIRQKLIHNYGIDEKKIIPFTVYAKNEIIENITGNIKDICGIILGNSHAYHAYLPHFLDERFINLSCPSQDIYHNYKAFQNYLKGHKNTIKKLKYVIFDLYDYNFFNCDISLTKELFNYIAVGGIIDQHNYNYNVHYEMSFEEELFKENCMISELQQEEKTSMDLLFGIYTNPLAVELMDNNVYSRWSYIKANEPLKVDNFLSDVVTKRFEKTILENIRIIEEFIRYIKRIDSDCKIIFTLIPRYITMEKTLSILIEDWKTDFENIIRELQRNWNGVYFLNYKNRIDISGNNRLYFDINHLNTMGGRCMSSILNEDIKYIEKSRTIKNG